MAYNSGKPLDGDDICIWPCDTYCDGADLEEMYFMSDDYFRIPVECEIWNRFITNHGMTYDEVATAIQQELAHI